MSNGDFQALVPRELVNKSNLRQNHYSISLINEGLRTRLLHRQEAYLIQTELVLIVQELIRRYTRGDSSSVAVETAERLFTSMLYALDMQMRSYERPEVALTALKSQDTRNLYKTGVERVRQCFEETRLLYYEIRRTKLDVPVDAYNTTIDESLPALLLSINTALCLTRITRWRVSTTLSQSMTYRYTAFYI